MKTLKKILVAVVLIGIVGTGIVEASPPTVVLKSPKAGIAKNAMVSFSGSAVDVEDGKLNDVLVWSSDIQGYLGFGPKIKIKLLPGLHTITLSVTDSEGYLSKAFVKLRIPGDEEIESGIELTSVPGYGKPGKVLGRVYGYSYQDYVIAGYIKVNGGWWTKPRWNKPTTKISKNNSFKLKISTAKTDRFTTEIAVFLIPKGYNPPLISGGQLPDYLFEEFHYAIYERVTLGDGFIIDFPEPNFIDDPCEVDEPIEPEIGFTFIPEIGAYQDIEGEVVGVNPEDYGVAVYIKVGNGWWQKPYWNRPVTTIKNDSTWSCDITTGGIDQTASEIVAYLIPKDYDPPANISNFDISQIIAEVRIVR